MVEILTRPDGENTMTTTITTEQRLYLTHMLGAERHIPKKQWGFRNYYCAGVGTNDESNLAAMAAAGLVVRGRVINDGDSVYFHATEAGMDAIALTRAQKANAMKK